MQNDAENCGARFPSFRNSYESLETNGLMFRLFITQTLERVKNRLFHTLKLYKFQLGIWVLL